MSATGFLHLRLRLHDRTKVCLGQVSEGGALSYLLVAVTSVTVLLNNVFNILLSVTTTN